jgi:hypothetical protein
MIDSSHMALLADHEGDMACLYAIFATRLPRHAEFWKRMVLEERAHAAVLHKLDEFLTAGRIRFTLPDVTLRTIMESRSFLLGWSHSVQSEDLTQKSALEAAWNLENLLLEKHVFDAFDGDSDEIRAEFRALHEHTVQHHQRIQDEARRHRIRLPG